MDTLQWLTQTRFGEFIFTILVSMLPVIEIRGGVPFGTALGLSTAEALLAGVIGNPTRIDYDHSQVH